MSQPQDTRVPDGLAVAPDPRDARGKRHPWLLLRTLLAVGRASGQQTARAPARWLRRRADDLTGVLPQRACPYSERVTPAVHPAAAVLEPALARLTTPQTAPRRWAHAGRPSPSLPRPAAARSPAAPRLTSSVWYGTAVARPSATARPVNNAARCAPPRGC